jgi:hypothetical protein
MKLTKYIEGSDADDHTCELADMSILTDPGCRGIGWHSENWWPESRVGELYIGLKGSVPAGSPPDVYGLNITPAEFGALLATMYRSADIQAVMSGFFERASPELIGAVVGSVIAHLAQRRIVPPAEQSAAADGGRDAGS